MGPKGILTRDTEYGVRKVEVDKLAGTGAANIAALEAELTRSPWRGFPGRARRHIASFNADDPICRRRGPIHWLREGA